MTVGFGPQPVESMSVSVVMATVPVLMVMSTVPVLIIMARGGSIHDVFVLELVFLCLAGVPDSGILSGQSPATWPYSSQSKHFMQGKWHAICPDS